MLDDLTDNLNSLICGRTETIENGHPRSHEPHAEDRPLGQ